MLSSGEPAVCGTLVLSRLLMFNLVIVKLHKVTVVSGWKWCLRRDRISRSLLGHSPDTEAILHLSSGSIVLRLTRRYPMTIM